MAKAAHYYLLTSSGEKFQISLLDFNNLKGRISKGQTKGWYSQRGESVGDQHDWSIQFKDVAGFWTDGKEAKSEPIAGKDVTKRLPPEVGKIEKEVKEECLHNWNRPETYGYVTEIINGMQRYHKHCPVCDCKSPLVKKREVELAMEAQGKTLDDVILLTGI